MIDLAAKPFYLKPEDIEWVNTTLAGMTTEEKAGQLFCVLFKECKPEEFEYVFNILKPGGCMYRVVPTERAIAATQNIYSRSKVPPLIAANLEKGGNGIVTEGTLVGAPMEIAATDDIGMATKMAHACAAEASAVGANWAFAPIIDIDTNYRNPITNTRTFGSDPERVRRMGRAYVEEVQKMGLAASIKHFPGDGQDERDQHLVTSINSMDCDPWMNTYGAAYKAGIEAGALTAMVGHIMQPAWTRRLNPGIKDEDIMPGTLSREMMQGLLRGELGFNGLICTDATTMAGYTLAMSRRRAVPESIARGADMFLFARNLEEDYGFMLQGIKDGMVRKPAKDQEQLKPALDAFQKQIDERISAKAKANLEASKKFMEENGKKEGVTTTKSGLQYKVVNKGGEEKFDEKKFKNPMFKVKYKGTLLDGTVFDDTKGKSVELPLQVIPGFAEALTSMPVGSKWIVYIPSELAYGENTPGAPIEPNSPLIFDLELDGISEAPAPQGGPMSISPEQLQEMLKQSGAQQQ